MSSVQYTQFPVNGILEVANSSLLPVDGGQGTLAVALDTSEVYIFYNGSWDLIVSPSGAANTSLSNLSAVAVNTTMNLNGHSLVGGTTASANLTIDSTSNATKGNVIIAPSGGGVAIGDGTTTYNNGIVIGPSSFLGAAAVNSVVLGYLSHSQLSNCTAVGYNAAAIGASSSAYGYASSSYGTFSSVYGFGSYTYGTGSTAYGYQVESHAYLQSSLGANNASIGTENPTSWVLTDPLIIVGNGPDLSSRSNALMILKSGNMGVGVDAPTAVVHIKAGTAAAGTAPLKLTAGTNLTTPEDGAIEFDGTNLYYTASGTRNTISTGGGGGGASTALDNLAAVAINADLVPGADGTLKLGSTTDRWLAANIETLNDVAGMVAVDVENRSLNDSAGTGQLAWTPGNVKVTNGSSLTLGLALSDPTAPGGSIYFSVSGDIRYYDGSTWKNLNGANAALSNLSATSINQSLISDTDVTYDLGATGLAWNKLYLSLLQDDSDVNAIDVTNRLLKDSSGTTVANFQNAAFNTSHLEVGHAVGVGSPPAIVAGPGAGTGPTVAVSGTDTAGRITVTTGSAPSGSAAEIVELTFAVAYNAAPVIILTPIEANAQALAGTTQVAVTFSNATLFDLTSGTVALTGSTTYQWAYHVIGV